MMSEELLNCQRLKETIADLTLRLTHERYKKPITLSFIKMSLKGDKINDFFLLFLEFQIVHMKKILSSDDGSVAELCEKSTAGKT